MRALSAAPPGLLEQGCSDADADLLDIVRQGELVFEAEGRTVGALRVYDVTEPLSRGPLLGPVVG